MTAPPIPVHLAHRLTVGGRAVPWVSLETDRGHHLGQVDDAKRARAIIDRRCQICGEPLNPARYVLFGRETDRTRGYVVEPAMHPECAAYTAKACPMLAGDLDHYRRTPLDVSDRTSPDGYPLAPAPDNGHRAGKPSEPYLQVWADGSDYRAGLCDEGVVLAWPARPLRVRLIATGPDRAALDLMKGTS
ncbi:hypothetical protein AB0I72_19485 [Nocardiopsis sp. NPDC049922]|uniref:hypothetical protein n=1 Tax=Nocardiopsis sp. NPDC049922 TaxID=3155157 RepID=UPI0033F5B2DA